MSEWPEVSVVIPTRNRHRLLALALASVLDQRDVSLEVIVVDEASTDDTAALLRSHADPRVRLLHNDVPLGKSAARNRGIAEARGEWVAFLDDDDIWAPEKLLLQIEALRTTGRSWAYTGSVNITEDHRVLGGAPPQPPERVAEELPRVNAVPGGCSSVMVRRNALPTPAFDGRYRLCEDWDLWIRLAQAGSPAYVAKPLVGYRVHSGNSSQDTARFLTELEMIENRYGGPVDRVVFYQYLARVSLRMNRQLTALQFYVRAAARDRVYRAQGFIPDAVGVLRAIDDRVRRRLGRPRRRSHQASRSDANARWKEEAVVWLEPFVRRHAKRGS